MTPTRGLVEYYAFTDTFECVDRDDAQISKQELFPQRKYTVFGDVFLFLSFLVKCDLINALRIVFPKDEAYERGMCHILHGGLKNGSGIS